MDVHSSQQRSYNMSRIRGADTQPEVWVRRCLHGMGFRFTVKAQNNAKLPGRPDLVLSRYRLCLFVHGCFWHAHNGCTYFKIPATRTEWWTQKLQGNAQRDSANIKALLDFGWRVGVVWECALRNETDKSTVAEQLKVIVADMNIPFFSIERRTESASDGNAVASRTRKEDSTKLPFQPF